MFSKNLAKYAFETYIIWLFLLDKDMLVDSFSKVVNSPLEIDCSMTSQWGLCQQIFVNNCKQPMFFNDGLQCSEINHDGNNKGQEEDDGNKQKYLELQWNVLLLW